MLLPIEGSDVIFGIVYSVDFAHGFSQNAFKNSVTHKNSETKFIFKILWKNNFDKTLNYRKVNSDVVILFSKRLQK